MKKPLALFDIDGTMIPGTTYFRVLEAQVIEGLIDEACVTTAYSTLREYKTGALSYERLIESLLDIYANGLKGKFAESVLHSTEKVLDECGDYYGYVAPTINALRDTHEVVIISGSPHFMAKAIQLRFGVDNSFSSGYEISDGIVTGRVASYLATREQKQNAIRHLVEDHVFAGSVEFGDSEGDIEVLRSVERPVCISPTAGLRQMAVENGWVIVDSENELNDLQPLRIIETL